MSTMGKDPNRKNGAVTDPDRLEEEEVERRRVFDVTPIPRL